MITLTILNKILYKIIHLQIDLRKKEELEQKT